MDTCVDTFIHTLKYMTSKIIVKKKVMTSLHKVCCEMFYKFSREQTVVPVALRKSKLKVHLSQVELFILPGELLAAFLGFLKIKVL